MSVLWTYSAGIVTVLLAFLSLYEDFYHGKSSKKRVGMSLGLIVATAITMISLRSADRQHTEDESKITELQTQIKNLGDLVQAANQTVKDTSKQLTDARATDTGKFLGEFDSLAKRVAQLQTQVATTDLKAEAGRLQADLESTRKAMDPEKAALTFSFDSASQGVRTVALPQHDNIVHLKVTVINPTDADALSGDVIITICDKCVYKSEPAGGQHLAGAPETQRNIAFERSLARTHMPTLEFDVQTPNFPFQLSVTTICHTCITPGTVRSAYQESLGTVYATNPQAQPATDFPPIPVHPLFGNSLTHH